jgi:hypothetical protein
VSIMAGLILRSHRLAIMAQKTMNWMCGTGALLYGFIFSREPSPFVRFTGSEMQYWSCFAERFSVQVGPVLASRRRPPLVGSFALYLKACIVRNVDRWVLGGEKVEDGTEIGESEVFPHR